MCKGELHHWVYSLLGSCLDCAVEQNTEIFRMSFTFGVYNILSWFVLKIMDWGVLVEENISKLIFD